jgi:hypothetical protein
VHFRRDFNAEWVNPQDKVSEIDDLLEESPSLRREMPEFIAKAYARGRKLASIEKELPIATFPEAPARTSSAHPAKRLEASSLNMFHKVAEGQRAILHTR